MGKLTPAAVSSLDGLVRTDADPRVRRRAQSLLAVAHAPTLREASRLTGVSRSTLARWRQRYLSDGRDGLADRARLGRPPKLPPTARTLLTTVLEELPTNYGYATATWTLADLQDLLRRRGWHVGVATVSRTVHGLGYVYRRPKHDLQHRQDADSVATAAHTLSILQKKGALTEQESAWSTAMNATCTPIRTWQIVGNDGANVPTSPPPASTSAALSTVPSSMAQDSLSGSTPSAPVPTDS